jgi:hypothetical protein
MNTVAAIAILILGLLLVFVWGVHILVQILGWVLIVAAVVWLIKFLGSNRRSDL